MKVAVDGELCSGHGRCYSLAPDVYEADDEGYNARRGSVVDVPDDQEEPARSGAQSCPEGALTVIES